MKGFIFILVGLLLSCGGAQTPRNSELLVQYEGITEVRGGGAYIDEATLREVAKQEHKTTYIVFSDDMCGACGDLKQSLKQRGWIDEVYFLNLDDKWVQDLAVIMKIKALPTMVVQLKNGRGTLYFEGPGEIMMHLVRKL